MEFRRVVTAVEEDGRSVVAGQDRLDHTETAMRPGYEFYAVWGTDVARLPGARPEPVHEPFYPGPGGTRFGLIRFPPRSSAPRATPAAAARDIPGLSEALEADPSPGMHTTQTVDYDVVLEGELILELDDGAEARLPAGTCIVQNGTRHTWHNRGDVPATLAYVVVGAEKATY